MSQVQAHQGEAVLLGIATEKAGMEIGVGCSKFLQ